jgi:anaerobic ribonucleoside-triphosphate reductase activating protein
MLVAAGAVIGMSIYVIVDFNRKPRPQQIEAVKQLAHEAHRLRLNVWCYTGWTWEEIMQDPHKRGLLAYIDVLVDGRFDLKQRSLELKWRGSKNQRVIDVSESLFKNEVVLLEE